MSARDDAIKALAKVADDWGWKGGKKGEITGTALWDNPRELYKDFLNQIKTDKDLAVLVPFEPSSNYLVRHAADTAFEIANGFRAMEQAGLPRTYTGKLYKSLLQRTKQASPIDVYDAWVAANSMKTMTNEQRTTFLQLLPRWTGTLEQAANAAKRLYRR